MLPAQPPLPPMPYSRPLPLRIGTRGSPLALFQARAFMAELERVCPALREMAGLAEHVISTTGDRVQDRKLAEIGGKGLFAKEIHEALADGVIDFAVHSLKDLETELPPGIVLACTMRREDPRDAIILPPGAGKVDPSDPYASLPAGALIGTASVRRQAQLLHARPDLRMTTLRGNVQTRLDKLARGDCAATLLAFAGLRRLDLGARADAVLDAERMVPAAGQGIVGVTARASDSELLGLRRPCPAPPPDAVLDAERMVPAAGQGIVGVTARASDSELLGLLAAIEDPEAKAVSTAERAMLATLDGSCRTPIGGFARLLPSGDLHLTGLVARADGSFLLKRALHGPAADAARIGAELGASLRADSPRDIFA